jgi:hypothetical protein
MFKDGRSVVVGRPSLVSDDLVQSVNQKSILKNFRVNVSQISRTVINEIIRVRLGHHKFCARLVSENAHGCAQNAENGFDFDFLERYHEDGDEFLNHIVRVTGDKTWVSFVNGETKEQSKRWMHTNSPNKPKNFKQTLSARKLMATVFRDRKGVLMVEFMQQGTTVTSEVY